MPRSESLLGRAVLRAVSLQPRTEETLEIGCLPSVRGLVVDCGLVFEKYIISVNSIRDGATTSRRGFWRYSLSLRDWITFNVDLEFVRGLNGLLGLGVNGSLHVGIFGFVDGRQEIKVLFSLLLLSAWTVTSATYMEDNQGRQC
jgi:hypothetical protein